MSVKVEPNKSEQKQAAKLAALMVFFGLVLLTSLTLSLKKDNQDLAVLFPLSMTLTDIAQTIAPLSVDMVRTGMFENIVILRPRNSSSINELKQVGALLVFDALVGGGCNYLIKKPFISSGESV